MPQNSPEQNPGVDVAELETAVDAPTTQEVVGWGAEQTEWASDVLGVAEIDGADPSSVLEMMSQGPEVSADSVTDSTMPGAEVEFIQEGQGGQGSSLAGLESQLAMLQDAFNAAKPGSAERANLDKAIQRSKAEIDVARALEGDNPKREAARQVLEAENVTESPASATEAGVNPEAATSEKEDRARALLEQKQKTLTALTEIASKQGDVAAKDEVGRVAGFVKSGEVTAIDIQTIQMDLRHRADQVDSDIATERVALRKLMDQRTATNTTASAENLQKGAALTPEQVAQQRTENIRVREQQVEIDAKTVEIREKEARAAELRNLADNAANLMELQELTKDNPELVAGIEAQMQPEVTSEAGAANSEVVDTENRVDAVAETDAPASEATEMVGEDAELSTIFEKVRHLEDLTVPELQEELERTAEFISSAELFVDAMESSLETIDSSINILQGVVEDTDNGLTPAVVEGLQASIDALSEQKDQLESLIGLVNGLVEVARDYQAEVEKTLEAKKKDEQAEASVGGWIEMAKQLVGNDPELQQKLVTMATTRKPRSFIDVLFMAFSLMSHKKRE